MKKVVNLVGRSDYEILTRDHPQMLARGLKLPIYTCRLYTCRCSATQAVSNKAADLCLSCPHMLKQSFSQRGSFVFFTPLDFSLFHKILFCFTKLYYSHTFTKNTIFNTIFYTQDNVQ